MSQVDQKRAFNKLKHDLEPWRNLIVTLESVLIWEKNYYPAIIGAVITVFYLLLWIMDFSVITLLALFGLALLAFDSLYPSVSRFFFNPDNWSGTEEAKFENICTQLSSVKFTVIGWYEYLFSAKERKSTVFLIIMTVSLLAAAWLGAVINNLVLMYILTLGLLMWPGVQEKRLITAAKEKFGGVVTSKIQQLREKTKKTE